MAILKDALTLVPVVGPFARRAYNSLQTRRRIAAAPGPFTAWKDIQKHLQLGVDYVYSAEVEGDIAEFGTMSGDTAETIAIEMLRCDVKGRRAKRLLLFDSFVGLPPIASKPDLESTHVRSGVWAPGGCKLLSRSQLETRLRRVMPSERLEFIEGWYNHTVPRLASETRLALLHVDCDLYQSTMDALQPLFAKGQVAEGAMIMFDDWYCNRASQSYGEQRAWSELRLTHQVQASDLGSYSWGGHRFIIHSYQTQPQ